MTQMNIFTEQKKNTNFENKFMFTRGKGGSER